MQSIRWLRKRALSTGSAGHGEDEGVTAAVRDCERVSEAVAVGVIEIDVVGVALGVVDREGVALGETVREGVGVTVDAAVNEDVGVAETVGVMELVPVDVDVALDAIDGEDVAVPVTECV